MDDVLIVPAVATDVEDILVIQEISGLSAWSSHDYIAEVDREGSVFLVSKTTDGMVSGFILGRIIPGATQPGPNHAEIYNLGVGPEFRRLGRGGKLIERFLAICSEHGVSTVLLEVRASNSNAKSFYASHGFTPAGRRPAFYSNPQEDAELMQIVLPIRGNFQINEGA